MKAKSRRRLLISSVAMLLVAMLALGTATFAWFTTDTSTTAAGIQVKTDKVSSLLVSSRTSEWTNDLDYEFYATENGTQAPKKLNPVSTANGVDWFYATAASPAGPAAEAGSVNKIANNTAAAAEAYMFYNMLNVKNAGTADITNPVYIELGDNTAISEQYDGSTTNFKYLRIALVPAKNGESDVTDSTRGNATVESANVFKANVYGATAGADGDTADGILTATADEDGSIATVGTVKTKDNKIKVEVTDSTTEGGHGLKAGSSKYYMLFVWFEGQDADCFDAHAGNDMPNLTFNIYEKKS